MTDVPTVPYIYRAELVRVIDGDTVVLAVDVGFNMTAHVHVRLLGVDCPEARTIAGEVATRRVREVFDLSVEIRVRTEKTDSFGRYLGDVYCRYWPGSDDDTSNWVNLSRLLVDEGLAVEAPGGEIRKGQ